MQSVCGNMVQGYLFQRGDSGPESVLGSPRLPTHRSITRRAGNDGCAQDHTTKSTTAWDGTPVPNATQRQRHVVPRATAALPQLIRLTGFALLATVHASTNDYSKCVDSANVTLPNGMACTRHNTRHDHSAGEPMVHYHVNRSLSTRSCALQCCSRVSTFDGEHRLARHAVTPTTCGVGHVIRLAAPPSAGSLLERYWSGAFAATRMAR